MSVRYLQMCPFISISILFLFSSFLDETILGNLRKGSVPSAFVDCLEKALSRALSSETQKELNLSSEQTFVLLEI